MIYLINIFKIPLITKISKILRGFSYGYITKIPHTFGTTNINARQKIPIKSMSF
jgi:hypothetical protein